MPKLFVESQEFTEWISRHLDDDQYANFQRLLADHPDAGNVMPGCGGIRKIRLADPQRQQGKRGGARVIYLHVPRADWVYLLDVYGKDEKDDMTSDEKKVLKKLAEQLKVEAGKSAGGARKGKRR